MIIYKITNLTNGKAYIGLTKRDEKKRFREHFAQSRWPSKSSDKRHLFNAMRKYGEECWSVEVIARAKTWEELCALEVKLIADHQTHDRRKGYNSTLGGEGANGLVFSPEVRARLSAARKGIPLREETKEKLRALHADPEYSRRCLSGLRAYKITDEHRAKMSAKMKGRIISEETKRKISASNKGKPKSTQHVANSVAARIGFKKTPEQIEKSAKFHRGKFVTMQTRSKIAAALKGNTNGSAQKKPFCGLGHPLSGENLYVYTIASGKQRSCCKICMAENNKRQSERRYGKGKYHAVPDRRRRDKRNAGFQASC